jgi:alpha-1,3-fucosyltransferase
LILDSKSLEWIKQKTKTAAWIVSNCKDVPSQRHLLVKQLQTYFDVDIYGKCGIHCPHFPKRCAYLSSYWFYFAFENSICPDYVTEKVYGKIGQSLVLVVFNGADMSKLLPPHSYIDANSFETAEDLAKYLIYLTKNPEEYIKFFWWKTHYTIHGWSRVDKGRICNALNKPSIDYKRQQYENMTAWFHKGCTEPKIKF